MTYTQIVVRLLKKHVSDLREWVEARSGEVLDTPGLSQPPPDPYYTDDPYFLIYKASPKVRDDIHQLLEQATEASVISGFRKGILESYQEERHQGVWVAHLRVIDRASSMITSESRVPLVRCSSCGRVNWGGEKLPTSCQYCTLDFTEKMPTKIFRYCGGQNV